MIETSPSSVMDVISRSHMFLLCSVKVKAFSHQMQSLILPFKSCKLDMRVKGIRRACEDFNCVKSERGVGGGGDT